MVQYFTLIRDQDANLFVVPFRGPACTFSYFYSVLILIGISVMIANVPSFFLLSLLLGGVESLVNKALILEQGEKDVVSEDVHVSMF